MVAPATTNAIVAVEGNFQCCLQDLRQQGLLEDNGKWGDVHDFGWLRAAKSPNW
jgi:hypothetical protein